MSSTSFIRPQIIYTLIIHARTWRRLRMRVIAYRADRSVDWPLGLSRLARAYTRTRDGSAHTPPRRTRRRSHSYARPLELHSFIKVARTDVASLTPHRAAPCFSPRPAFYERSVRCLSTVNNAHARGLRAGERLCANGRDRYRRP